LSGPEASGSLWNFAVCVYGQDGISAACLRLQQIHGIDIPLLLFSAWLGARDVTLSEERAREARSWVSDWHRDVVKVLRQVRNRLKSGPPPAPNAATEALRTAVKRAELESEKLQLGWLKQRSATWLADGDRPCAGNLAMMFHSMTGQPADHQAMADLNAIAHAACQTGVPA
jgi:uncharacterized protein (TIGR02444 family)